MSDKPLGQLPKRKRKKIQINKTRYKKKGRIPQVQEKIQTVIREDFENLDSPKLKNPLKMNKFLDAYAPLKLNPEDTNNFNREL